MFGGQQDNSSQPANGMSNDMVPPTSALDETTGADVAGSSVMPDAAASPTMPDLSLPSAPATDAPADDAAADAPADTTDAATDSSAAMPAPAVGADDLLDIKQQALQQLSPLVDHLDQTPEDKFRTTMMMIQAADNSSLIQRAYEAAEQITDEKVKAQALLDIVNEINYFTQHHNDTK